MPAPPTDTRLPATSLRRLRGSPARTTNVELFFDLVYAFAITQLAELLLDRPTVRTALQTLVLFSMVWLAWSYTTWVTNWLDPDRLPVRFGMLVLTFVTLLMAAELPAAFTAGRSAGLIVGCCYAVMQVGRSAGVVVALRGDDLQINFKRILSWCVLSGMLAVAGGLAHGDARALLWAGAVLVDFAGSEVGFYTPGLGRSSTTDWTIEGGHFAERCQAFLLLALGESVIVIGASFATHPHVRTAEVAAFVLAFVGAAALWWIYFDRTADAAAARIAAAEDPGRLGRNAYHLVHPVMVAAIIVSAAADQQVLAHPQASTDTATALLVLGGSALFVAGHALFKRVVFGVVQRPAIVAVVALGLLGLIAPHVTALALAACACAVLVVLAAYGTERAAASARGSLRTTRT